MVMAQLPPPHNTTRVKERIGLSADPTKIPGSSTVPEPEGVCLDPDPSLEKIRKRPFRKTDPDQTLVLQLEPTLNFILK